MISIPAFVAFFSDAMGFSQYTNNKNIVVKSELWRQAEIQFLCPLLNTCLFEQVVESF